MKNFKYFLYLLLIFSFVRCSTRQENNDSLSRQPLPDNLGVNIHFYAGAPRDWKMMTTAGVGIVRMDVSWAGNEKEKGQYDFSRYDALIDSLQHRHMKLIFILDYGNPLYDDGKAPHTEAGRMAFARFARTLAVRYAGKKIIWELWNEPNLDKFWKPKSSVEDYMKWCKAVTQSIRMANKDAFIVGPASSGIDFPFLEACFSRGLLDLVDGVTVHPYRGPDRSPETVYQEYMLLQGLIKQYEPPDKKIPVLSGEWGYNTTVMSREQQGKYLPRQWLVNLNAGVPLSIWYDWHDDGQDPKEGEHNFGTVTWDYQPKPAYVAMKKLISALKGYHYLMRLDVGSINDYVLLFIRKDKLKLAMWTKGDPHILPSDAGWLKGFSSLVLTDVPVYLPLPDPKPWWADLGAEIYSSTSEACSQSLRNFQNGKGSRDKVAGTLLKYFSKTKNTKDVEMVVTLLMQLAHNSDRNTALSMYQKVLTIDAGVLNTRNALYGLMKYNSVQDTAVVQPYLKHPQLSADAANVLLFYAYHLARKGKSREAKRLLVQGLKYSPATYFANRTVELLKLDKKTCAALAKRAGFMVEWHVIGPFPHEGNKQIEASFEKTGKIKLQGAVKSSVKSVFWQKYATENIWGIVPLAEMYGRIRGAAYLYGEIESPEQKTVQFKIGSNDGVICWLNGKKVHQNLTGRPLVVDNDVFTATLKKGKNRILLKVINEGNNWAACMRVKE